MSLDSDGPPRQDPSTEPIDASQGRPRPPERREAGAALWEKLRSILESALAEGSGDARVDIEPMRAAAVLRPENEMQPEVALRARVVHPETFQAVTPGERDKIAAFEKKLVAMGLRAGHW